MRAPPLRPEDADVEQHNIYAKEGRHADMHQGHEVCPERVLGVIMVLAERQRQLLPHTASAVEQCVPKGGKH